MNGPIVRLTRLALLAIVALVGCTPTGTSSTQSPAAGGPPAAIQRTLAFAVRGEPPSLAARPLITFSGALSQGAAPFNATFDYRDERGTAQPVLSEGLPVLGTDTWQAFPDGTMETKYKLRPNLTWHDGKPLTADDFAFAYTVYSAPWLNSISAVPIGQMSGVIAQDPSTVLIRWKQPYPEADSLANGFQALPRHILEPAFREADPLAFPALPFWTNEYVGVGPYALDSWEPGASISGHAFEGFALGKPKIDKLRVVFIPDPQTALANLLAGEVHYVGTLIFAATEGETLESQWAANQAGRVLYSASGFRSLNFQLRPEAADPPELTDVRMRRAISFAIDKQSAVDILSGGKGLLTHTITAPTVDYYSEIDKVITKYTYDPRRTGQLLEEIGFVKGANGFYARRDGQPLKVGAWSSSGTKNEAEAATYIDSMRRAGIDASQNIITAAQIGDPQLRALLPGVILRGGGPALNGLTSGEIARPENRWNGGNRYGWSNPDYDRAFDSWTKSLAKVDRTRYIADMERLITDQLPILPNYFEATVTAALNTLEGPKPELNPEAGPQLATLYQWYWRA
jgi:peptide/nickel transport system substrate-binding protein